MKEGWGNSRRSKQLPSQDSKKYIPAQGHAIDEARPDNGRIGEQDERAQEGAQEADIWIRPAPESQVLNICPFPWS
jgi:hypothetical protein